ncbi:exonuclease V a 5' deoxyribonuclease-domain-containing protein [Mycena leptocephala]|nr:exonuclease V a 5' deoxyribonuclease-domain-containing protein [Mycena leptocephala]
MALFHFAQRAIRRSLFDQMFAARTGGAAQRGRVFIHKELERELRAEEVEIEIASEEERMGYPVSLTGVMVILANVLSLINFLFCLVSFIAEGRAREIPVFGIVEGVIVVGSLPIWAQDGTKRASDSSPPPPKRRYRGPSPPPELIAVPLAPTPSPKCIRLIDTKTRRGYSVPSDEDAVPAHLQVMLYHRLLSRLIDTSIPFDFSALWTLLGMRPSAPFSPTFLRQAAPILDGPQPIPVCLEDIVLFVRTRLIELDLPRVDDTVQIIYLSQNKYFDRRRREEKTHTPATCEDDDIVKPIQMSIDDMVGVDLPAAPKDSADLAVDLAAALKESPDLAADLAAALKESPDLAADLTAALKDRPDLAAALKESTDLAAALKESEDLAAALKESEDHAATLKESEDLAAALKESADLAADLAAALKESPDLTATLKESEALAAALKESTDLAADLPAALKEIPDLAAALKRECRPRCRSQGIADVAAVLKESADLAAAFKESADLAADLAAALKESPDLAATLKESEALAATLKESTDLAADLPAALRESPDLAAALKESADLAVTLKESTALGAALKESADLAAAFKESADLAADLAVALKESPDLAATSKRVKPSLPLSKRVQTSPLTPCCSQRESRPRCHSQESADLTATLKEIADLAAVSQRVQTSLPLSKECRPHGCSQKSADLTAALKVSADLAVALKESAEVAALTKRVQPLLTRYWLRQFGKQNRDLAIHV